MGIMRRHRDAIVAGAIVILIGVLLMLSGKRWALEAATKVWTAAIAVVGLNLLLGYAGQVSLGHAAFGGIGAYAVAVLPKHFGLPPLLSLLIGMMVAGLVAYLAGRPILRLRGHYLAVATLGLGILIAMVLNNEVPLTGGPDGMEVAQPALMGWLRDNFGVRSVAAWYWIAGLVLVAGVWLAANLVESPTGRALRAIHDSEVAARVAGIDVAEAKLRVFVVSAVYAAVGGALLAWSSAYIKPDVASFLHSVELLTMVVLGGAGSLVGSIVGALLLVLLPQALAAYHDWEHLFLGLVMIVVMVFLPRGIVPSLGDILQRQRP